MCGLWWKSTLLMDIRLLMIRWHEDIPQFSEYLRLNQLSHARNMVLSLLAMT